MNRRNFLKFAGVAAVAVPTAAVVSKIGRIDAAHAQDMTKALDEAFPMASALGYVHDASKADPAKRTPEKKDNICKNCVLLQSTGMKVEGKEGVWGKCGLFATQGLVNENGWCLSWAPKAA